MHYRVRLYWFAALILMPMRLAGQEADSSVRELRTIVGDLPSAARLRIASDGQRWTGRLTLRSSDSLGLGGETATRAVSLAEVDTLWVPGRERHGGLLAGAAFGTVMFGVLQVGKSAEDPGLNTTFGLLILGGSTALGLLLDAATDSWDRRYPE